MKRLMIIFLISMLLCGCAPTVFVAGAVAGGAVIYDHRKAKVIVEDRDVTFRVQASLDNDRNLREKANISITAFNHIALLLGQAPTEKLRNHAELIAKSNSKIKILYNEVTISKPISITKRANDSWITTKVKTILLATPGLKSSDLKIVTEDAVVYMMGLTTRSQADLATEQARTAAGVKKVVKLFEYIN